MPLFGELKPLYRCSVFVLSHFYGDRSGPVLKISPLLSGPLVSLSNLIWRVHFLLLYDGEDS